MNEQELNQKLAEWVGFKSWYKGIGEDAIGIFIDTDKVIHGLNFTNSFDACFKWILPKVREHNEIRLIFPPGDTRCLVKIGWSGYSVADVPSLATCLATEKLIDSRK